MNTQIQNIERKLEAIHRQQQKNTRARAKLDRALAGEYQAHNVRGAIFAGFALSSLVVPLLCFVL